MSYSLPRGTQDILPGKVEIWHSIEKEIRELSRRFNYHEIRTPIFEHTELFQRGVGDSTDIVQKEMYSFEDRGERSLTLRPEGTAGVVRAFVEHKMFGQPDLPEKLYYVGPMFRYERPQAGRYRQFHQFGIEAIGSVDPAVDVEVMSFAVELFRKLGLRDTKLVVNSLGDASSRIAHREALVEHFSGRINEFCSDCQRRLHQNPLRILDCKKDHEHELVGNAPSILSYLNEESRTYFEKVKQYLDALAIPYEVDPTLVRGLDYYNHTCFEVMSTIEGFGAQTTLGGGGRYDGLVEQIGGPSAPGIGFGIGLERVVAAIEAEKSAELASGGIDVFVVALGDEAKDASVSLLSQLRSNGLSADKDYAEKKMKAQLKQANRKGARFVVILGEDELAKGIGVVKVMTTGEQIEVSVNEVATYVAAQKGGA
ncbi:histidine--tRNA ligase [Bacillus fonticola]|uniref:histidine--tRNA ligase n=1 Tax=Bacillus fonticola TaxID=2728853 RepID=UPI0014744C64|nr:histidine--tRNA ligase [Bacillus fonticola]